jgi:hypothetical protein
MAASAIEASKKARIYVAFPSSRLFGSTDTYPLHHPEQKVLGNEEILDAIAERCEGVEFVGGTDVEAATTSLANVKRDLENLDGVLYFGALPNQLLGMGLPIIAVHPLWGHWQYPFVSYTGHKVLTACLPVIPDASEEIFSSRLDYIAQEIALVQTVAKMKGLRVLIVTDKPILGQYEPTALQTEEEGWDGYETHYLENLGALGVEAVTCLQDEMLSTMEAVDQAEAQEVTQKWMAEASGIRGTNEIEIRKSASLYLAMKQMMDKYAADAITTEGYGVFMQYKDGPIPCQGMASSQLCTDGVVATSETLVDSLITQQLGLFVTGSTGFNGDYVIDENNQKAYIGHCECPFNPYGDERRVPYAIRNLPQWGIDEQEKGGASAQVFLPAGETVTVAKFSVHDKKLSLFGGRTVDGEKLFPGWYDILCRTKVAIETDATKLLRNVDWRTFGVHRVVFYGDYRQQFKDLATLLGYDAVEKDA